MEPEKAAAMIAGSCLSCLMLLRMISLVLLRFVALGRGMRKFLRRQMRLFRARVERPESESETPEQERLKSEILKVRLVLVHGLLSVYAAVAGLVVAANMANIYLRAPSYLTMGGSWLMIAGLAVLTCYAFLPRSLLKDSTLNAWFAFFVLLCVLFSLPWSLPVFRTSDAVLLCIFTRLPTSVMPTRTLWVALGNATISALVVCRFGFGLFSDQQGGPMFVLFAMLLELGICTLTVVFSAVMGDLMRQRASLRCENTKISTDNSAIRTLLRLMSDAVIELDQDLRLIRHSPELSAMLLRDRPGASTEGTAFTDFIHAADAPRAAELLLNPHGVIGAHGTCAHAFHTRLVDTFSNKVCVEVFTVKTETSEGEVRHLLGLRDFTDTPSLSGERATDARDCLEETFSFSWPVSMAGGLNYAKHAKHSFHSEPMPVAPALSPSLGSASWSPADMVVEELPDWQMAGPVKKHAYLDLDMEVKVVASASASVAFVAGTSLEDFFPSAHTLQLLQQVCDEAQRSLQGDGSIPNKVFNFNDLPVRWTSSRYGSLIGTFQVVRTRFGGLGVLLAFEEPQWSQTSHRSSRASGRSTSSRNSKKQRPMYPTITPSRGFRNTLTVL